MHASPAENPLKAFLHSSFKAQALALAGLLFSLAAPAALAEEKGFATKGLNVGYLPESTMGERVSVEELAAYVKKLEPICRTFFAEETKAENLNIVVAIKPGGKVRVWLVSTRTGESKEQRQKRAELRKLLAAVEPPTVQKGPIAFCLNGQIAAGVKQTDETGAPPLPSEWIASLETAKRESIETFDKALRVVWPD